MEKISGFLLMLYKECHRVYIYSQRRMPFQVGLAQEVIFSVEGCRTNLSLCPSMARNGQFRHRAAEQAKLLPE